MNDDLKITSWYLNSHRVIELLGADNIPLELIELLKGNSSHPLSASILISSISPVIISWIRHNKIKSIEEIILRNKLRKGAFFTIDTRFHSKGLAGKTRLDGHEIIKLRCKFNQLDLSKELLLEFHSNGLTTATALHKLKGNPSVFVFGYIDEIDENYIYARPFVIGDLLEDTGTGFSFRYRNNLEIRPEEFDSLKEVDFSQLVANKELHILKQFPEKKIKEFFANVIGEPDIQKDWGGEEDDLFSVNVYLDGKRKSCSFAFKGPSKFKPMEIADCGKNGDQIVRLFQTPAEILILQHCHKINPSVRKMMQAFALSNLITKRKFCLIDGYETYKILKHFGKLKNS